MVGTPTPGDSDWGPGLSLPGFLFSPCWISWCADIEEAGVVVVKCQMDWNHLTSDPWSFWRCHYSVTMALVVHQCHPSLAYYHAANVDLTLEDFNDFQERVPLADLKPRKYAFQDLTMSQWRASCHETPLKNGFLPWGSHHPVPVNGIENLEAFADLDTRSKSSCHLKIRNKLMVHWSSWKGTWQPEGGCWSIRWRFATSRVLLRSLTPKKLPLKRFFRMKSWMATHVVRSVGPKVDLVCWKCRPCHPAIGKGQGDERPLTDGRFRWTLLVSLVDHIAPELRSVPTAYLHTGDLVTVDQDTKEITMYVQTKNYETGRLKQPCHHCIAVGFCKYALSCLPHHVVL